MCSGAGLKHRPGSFFHLSAPRLGFMPHNWTRLVPMNPLVSLRLWFVVSTDTTPLQTVAEGEMKCYRRMACCSRASAVTAQPEWTTLFRKGMRRGRGGGVKPRADCRADSLTAFKTVAFKREREKGVIQWKKEPAIAVITDTGYFLLIVSSLKRPPRSLHIILKSGKARWSAHTCRYPWKQGGRRRRTLLLYISAPLQRAVHGGLDYWERERERASVATGGF